MQGEATTQTLPRGVILWDMEPPPVKRNHGRRVMVRCECGDVRPVNLNAIARRGGTGLCRSCQRMDGRKSRPNKAVAVSRGVILWDEPMVRHGSQGQWHVWARCECGEKRLIHPSDLRRRRFTGLCRKCHTREHYATLNNKSGPESSNFRGYRHVEKRGGYAHIALYPGDDFYETMGVSRSSGQCRYVLEHRLVMARHLGRPLGSWEQVHHKDGDKLNNSPGNLEILDGKTHSMITAMQKEIDRLTAELHRLRASQAGMLLLPVS